VYYYCYEAVKAVYQKSKRPIGTLESMVCGTIAGIAVVLATHPIWTVNVKPKEKKKPSIHNKLT
jgi:adenine nucleotide transporter 17